MDHGVRSNVNMCHCCWQAVMVATPVSCYMQAHTASVSIHRMYAEGRIRDAVRGLSRCLLVPHTAVVFGIGTRLIITGFWQTDAWLASE